MAGPPQTQDEGAEHIDSSTLQPAATRGTRARRVFRSMALAGFLCVVAGIVIGLSAAGPSVPATIVLFAGLFLAGVGLVGNRLVFWAEFLSKDRETRGRQNPP